MDSSAPKRRRTSPRTAVPGDNGLSTTPPDPPPGPANRPQRPSFTSPTKASLSRHNPDILQKRRPHGKRRNDDQAAASRRTSQASEDMEAMLSAQLEQQLAEPVAGTAAVAEDHGVSSQSAAAPMTDVSRASSVRKLGGNLGALPRRSPHKPNPRPLPPPGPVPDEDMLNPFAGRTLRRSGVSVFPAQESTEPELPPTPEHPDPEITTPPSGIHNTPSKRARRSKTLAEKIKSSPLKPIPSKQPPSKKLSSKPPIVRRGSPPKLDAPTGRYTRANREKGGRPTAHRVSAARRVAPLDPDATKKRKRDTLLADIASLERDLDIVAKENERIRAGLLTRVEVTPSPDGAEIIDVLKRRVLPPSKEVPDATALWLQAAINPMAFLPFGKSAIPGPFDEPAPEEEAAPVSHHPIPMSSEEELPYLQAFSPLSYSSTITILPSEEGSLLQKHSITATSSSPVGLFAAQIDMVVDTNTLSIIELSVPRVDPAAMAELNPFIERVVNKTNPSSALTHNINALARAMGEWLRVAMRRARVWLMLEKELGSKEALAETVARLESRRKRTRRPQHGEEDSLDADGQEYSVDSNDDLVSRAELLRHLGRSSMDFDIPMVEGDGAKSGIRVQWRIEFDWTGEAQSRICALVGVPGKWRRADDRGSLSGLSKLFDQLLQGNADPSGAVRTIVALLAREST